MTTDNKISYRVVQRDKRFLGDLITFPTIQDAYAYIKRYVYVLTKDGYKTTVDDFKIELVF